MPLTDIVDVQISRETTAVSRVGFGTLLIVGPNLDQGGGAKRIDWAASLTEVAALLTGGAADEEYAAAVTLFSQSPSPSRVAIGYAAVGDADMGVTLTAIQNESDDWYGVMIVSRTQQDQLDASEWVQTATKIFGVADDDPNTLLSGDVTSLAYQLKALDRWRTFVLYSGQADGTANDPFPEAGMFGTFLTRDPGSYTVMFKTITGVTVDTLTSSQATAVLSKNASTYELIGGVAIIREGTTSENTTTGEYIDVVVFIDWLQARMTEDVYTNMVNLPKIPFTDPGAAVIEGAVKSRLQKGINSGGLAADPAPVVFVPLVANVDTADKAARLLPDVTFTGTLAGAIHATQIRGVVTL
jgi:hypothetical protein